MNYEEKWCRTIVKGRIMHNKMKKKNTISVSTETNVKMKKHR